MNYTDLVYVIPTLQVDPDTLDKLNTKNSSREKDGQTIKMPSQANPCPIQLWEVYFLAGILLLQPPSSVIISHVKALCEHSEERHLCEAILREHAVGVVADVTQDISWYTFFEEYMFRKLSISFTKNSLLKYLLDVIDDPLCGKSRIPRSFLVAPFLQAFLLNTNFFDGQYDELVDSMRLYNLPLFDFLAEPETEVGEATGIDWDAVRLYDDPSLILKKHGGWAVTKGAKLITPKDQLIIRLTGLSLEQILSSAQVPDSPRRVDDDKLKQGEVKVASHERGRQGSVAEVKEELYGRNSHVQDDVVSNDSSHPSDFDIDPEHPKVAPFGLTVCEAYCLFRGLLIANQRGMKHCVIREPIHRGARDGHILAAAVIMDLYMREQVDVHHWSLTGGTVSVPYRCHLRRGCAPMIHFLDQYRKGIDTVFCDMRVQPHVGDQPIWRSLEERGVIDNHRGQPGSWGVQHVDVWDFVRPDWLHDIKDGYLTSARVLYDKNFNNTLGEYENDMLMFCYVLQSLFDVSFESLDGMARVLNEFCPPFQKGELFPPVTMVHAGTVCHGLADRGFRAAMHQETNLAQEAAEYNEIIMDRFEHKFFLSEQIWESFDVDGSGELSLEEFVEGMRKVDVYKDFRKERIPDAVLRMIVTDLAERLFREVDVNGDGTLNGDELSAAFKRRRAEALKVQERRQWVRTMAKSIAEQVSSKKKGAEKKDARTQSIEIRDRAVSRTKLQQTRRSREWSAEIERPQVLDQDADIDAPLPSAD